MGKTRQPFSAVSEPKFIKCGEHEFPVDWQISFRLYVMFRWKDMFGQSAKLVPKAGFLFQPVGVNARGSLDQNFQIAVISEYVS